MHLPDGFLDAKTSLLSAGAAVGGVALALRQVRATLEPRRMPLLGLAAAFVFAAQMLNFPVAGGTSGHLLGGVMTAVLLGPSAAVVVVTCVLIVQCLMFSDGGLLALGANVFNMGLVSVCGGYFVFRLVKQIFPMEATRSTVFAAAFAGWCGTVLAAASCAGQIAFSGTAPWGLVFPAMFNVHMLVGVGEGLATGLITLALFRARPELVEGATPDPSRKPEPWKGFLGYGVLIAVGLAVFVGPFACPWPDGLEAVSRKLGFEGQASAPVFASPLAEYRFPLVGSATTATALAGLVGTLVALLAAYGLARWLVPVLGNGKKDAPSGS